MINVARPSILRAFAQECGWLAVVIVLPISNCVRVSSPSGESDGQSAFEIVPVELIATERLVPPAVGTEPAFQPPPVEAIDASDDALGKATGFFVSVSTSAPNRLKARLTDDGSGAWSVLTKVSSPVGASERALAAVPRAFNSATRSHLLAGRGVFWVGLPETDGPSGITRVGVLLSETAIAAIAELTLFVTEFGDTPVAAAKLEIVPDFFYMVVIGDSVQWGNGLREQDKISKLVSNVIQQETQKKVIVQRYAQSGARIVPTEEDAVCFIECFGEAPTVSTSVTRQVEQIIVPELIDFVLMDGCSNDVDVAVIVNPLTQDVILRARTEQFCGDEMETLLLELRETVPNAFIVVAGYYPFVGPESELLGISNWAEIRDVETAPTGVSLVEALAKNSALFVEVAHVSLAQAVANVNEALAGDVATPLGGGVSGGQQTGINASTIAFVDPQFGSDNAVFGPDPWVWGMTADNDLLEAIGLDLALAPEEPIRLQRRIDCAVPDVHGGFLSCLFSSVGHPNTTGAAVYAEAIVAELRRSSVLPAAGD